ncbi:MAG: AAA family ATPase [Chloroherpetonaceae bacterium]
MSKSMIDELTIENFKSIKALKLKPKRINLFVGKPNTGKSNILEALSLFSNLSQSDLRDFVRFEKLRHLFYDGNVRQRVQVNLKVQSDDYTATFSYEGGNALDYHLTFHQKHTPPPSPITSLPRPYEPIQNRLQDGDSIIVRQDFSITRCKKYTFRKIDASRSGKSGSTLQVPFGQNLYYVLETTPTLFEEVAMLFEQYGLSLVLNQETDTLLTQKKIGHRVFQLPYTLVADTLQRMIFYLAAVKTNSESVLIFEEPETHSFPPYIQHLAVEIANSRDNQFFIATHSPYLFNTILEEAPKEDVAVFVVDYEHYQTVVHPVSEEGYGEIIDYGIDIFFNLRRAMKKDAEMT